MNTQATSKRLEDLQRFYALLGQLAQRLGGARTLAESTGRQRWPARERS